MGALFDGTATYMSNIAPPVTGYPFTVGLWFYPTATTDGVLFSISNTGTTNNHLDVRRDNTTQFLTIIAQGGAGSQLVTMATADPVNSWVYVLGRFINGSNRRMSALHAGGATEHVQNVAAVTPTGINTNTLGVLLTSGGTNRLFTGLIGEYFLTNTDVQPDGAQTDDNFLRQLAYHGPLSVPDVAKDLIEYHSMRSSLPHLRRPEESYFGKAGIQTWTDAGTNATQLGPHPPLPFEYDGPQPSARMLTI